MNKAHGITVDELAAFMNQGWPGEDWFLTADADYLWERTFTTGTGAMLYQPVEPGRVVELRDYDGRVAWQGPGRDPTAGRGYRLAELFLQWQRKRSDAVLVAYVPRAKLKEVEASLASAGCLLVTS